MRKRARQHAVTRSGGDDSMLTLTVRLPADKRRAFASMCTAEGVSQQAVVAAWVDDLLDEYAAAKAARVGNGEQ